MATVRLDLLTRKQRLLVQELEEIAEIATVDFANIRDYDRGVRTVYLELMRNQLVRGFVIMKYTLIDEFLGSEVCRYFFRPKRGFIKLWRTKRFRTFNHYVMEELSLLQKLRLVKAIHDIPKGIAGDVERINALRNGLAHAFFPENLRKSPPFYKGRPIFSLEGVKLFSDDVHQVTGFFVDEFYGGRKKWEQWAASPS
jgi:hypothetical protein